jgi:hypothetical protein
MIKRVNEGGGDDVLILDFISKWGTECRLYGAPYVIFVVNLIAYDSSIN